MPTKKKPAKRKRDQKELVADAKRALKETEKNLKMELKKVKSYIHAMDWHTPYKF